MANPKNKPAPPPTKEYFTVRVEVLAPVTLTYQIYAESPEKAIELAVRNNGQNQTGAPKILFAKLKNIKATAYTAGTNLIRSIQNLR